MGLVCAGGSQAGQGRDTVHLPCHSGHPKGGSLTLQPGQFLTASSCGCSLSQEHTRVPHTWTHAPCPKVRLPTRHLSGSPRMDQTPATILLREVRQWQVVPAMNRWLTATQVVYDMKTLFPLNLMTVDCFPHHIKERIQFPYYFCCHPDQNICKVDCREKPM